MENQSGKKNSEKEKKVGVIPVSESEGSDADTAYNDEEPKTRKEGKEHKGIDSDSHDLYSFNKIN